MQYRAFGVNFLGTGDMWRVREMLVGEGDSLRQRDRFSLSHRSRCKYGELLIMLLEWKLVAIDERVNSSPLGTMLLTCKVRQLDYGLMRLFCQ